MFQFPWFPRFELCVRSTVRRHAPARVSPFGYLRLVAAAHASPELFVVYHVLLRHATPRHSPYALVASPQNMCCEDLFSLALHISLLLMSSRIMHLVKNSPVPTNQPSPQTKTARQLVGPRTCDTFNSCLYLALARVTNFVIYPVFILPVMCRLS